MPANEPHNHHYVPQFFLRNFAVDAEKRRIATVAKENSFAVWKERSIKGLGFEHDLYVHFRHGVPVSVERAINERIETPISQSDTWAKIFSGRTDTLDKSDKPILYALIRHLAARTPHHRATTMELARLADSPNSPVPFTDEERKFYALLRANPERANEFLNGMAESLVWTEAAFSRAAISIMRSPILLRSSTTPVMTIPAPAHPALHLPLPGMAPHQFILTLDRTTIASLVLADFDDAFTNVQISADVARAFNRHFVGQFAYFDQVRHLITDRNELTTDMTWAPYDVMEDTDRKITFRKRN
jgi:hypothetical protein